MDVKLRVHLFTRTRISVMHTSAVLSAILAAALRLRNFSQGICHVMEVTVDGSNSKITLVTHHSISAPAFGSGGFN